MKVTKSVLDVVRGIGGAAAIAAAAAGCATGPTAEAGRHVNAPVAALRASPPPKTRPDARAQPEWRYDDVAAACGRG